VGWGGNIRGLGHRKMELGAFSRGQEDDIVKEMRIHKWYIEWIGLEQTIFVTSGKWFGE